MSTVPEAVRVYVDGRGVSVRRGGTALDAVRAADAAQADALAQGTLALTDSRGLPVAADAPVYGGAIYRVVPVRSRPVVEDDE